MRYISALWLILVFMVFYAISVVLGLYGPHPMALNSTAAILLTYFYNPSELKHKSRLVFGSIGIVAVIAAFMTAPMYAVFIYAFFVMSGIAIRIFSGLKDGTGLAKSLIFIAAFFNLSFVTYTTFRDVQYDPLSCFNYVEYIMENNLMFWQENPMLNRPSYSAYHPILSFFISAVMVIIANVFIGDIAFAAETAQIAACFEMFCFYLIVNKILKLFSLPKILHIAVLIFIVFFPVYNAMAGYLNNDTLLLPLMAGALYHTLCYAQTGGRKNLFYILLYMTLGGLTKLSAILLLPVIGTALLIRLWQKRDWQTFREEVIFGILLILGLSLWPLYQFFWLDLPWDYVPPPPGGEHLLLDEYSLWERFSPWRAFSYQDIFYHEQGINLWETLTKTALFGQWDFSSRCRDIMFLIFLLTPLYRMIILFVAGCFIYLLIRSRRDILNLILLVFLISLLTGVMIFSLKYPYMCNQDFRYIAILPLSLGLILAKALKTAPKTLLIFALFGLSLFALISTLGWWYVTKWAWG